MTHASAVDGIVVSMRMIGAEGDVEGCRKYVLVPCSVNREGF